MLVIVAVVGHAAARAAKGKGGANDRRKTNVFNSIHAFLHGVGDGRFGVFDAQTVHRLAKQFAVFGHLDGLAVRADQLDAEFLQHAHVRDCQRGVQAGLPAHGGQEGVWAFFFDDLGDDFRRDWLNIGGVSEARIGHDRRGVRIDEDDAVAFFAQGFTGLSAGIVELAGLPDDDGPGPDDHDGFDIVALRHTGVPAWQQWLRRPAGCRQNAAMWRARKVLAVISMPRPGARASGGAFQPAGLISTVFRARGALGSNVRLAARGGAGGNSLRSWAGGRGCMPLCRAAPDDHD